MFGPFDAFDLHGDWELDGAEMALMNEILFSEDDEEDEDFDEDDLDINEDWDEDYKDDEEQEGKGMSYEQIHILAAERLENPGEEMWSVLSDLQVLWGVQA